MKNFPTIKDLCTVIAHVKKQICDDYRESEDELPNIQLTVGYSEDKGWDYQTGDNSYSGGAYLHPTWGVVNVYRRSNARELARSIQTDLLGQTESYKLAPVSK